MRCDGCFHEFRGNAVGDFAFDWEEGPKPYKLPPVKDREKLWGQGEWNASWYCVRCFAKMWDLDTTRVRQKLGFEKRELASQKYR